MKSVYIALITKQIIFIDQTDDSIPLHYRKLGRARLVRNIQQQPVSLLGRHQGQAQSRITGDGLGQGAPGWIFPSRAAA